MLELNEVEQSRKDKIGELREQRVDPFGHSFGDTLATAYIAKHFDEL